MDESTRVRRAAAGALARLRPEENTPLVFRALEDADSAVLAHAARAASALRCLDARPRLAALTSHADAHVALAALDGLSLLGGLDDQVLVSAADHADPEVLKQVLALGADRLTVVALARDALNHPQWDVRVAAGRLLAVAGSRADVLALHDAAARESDPVAREALDALGHRTA
jgi:HEAT repeat protein